MIPRSGLWAFRNFFWLILLLAGASVGCNKPPSVVGKWTGTFFGQDAVTVFKDDKSLTMDLKGQGLGASFKGTYTIDPKILTITMADYKLKNVPDTLVPLATKLLDPLKSKPYHLTYHFNSPDELALTLDSKTDVLKRAPAE